jgi:Mn-dependent DtxR family transcriptional regulator
MSEHSEGDLIESLLDQTYTKDGKSVEIRIFRLTKTPWSAEVVDGFGNSTVWDGTFETDAEALEFVLSEIKRDGIDEFIGDPSSPK